MKSASGRWRVCCWNAAPRRHTSDCRTARNLCTVIDPGPPVVRAARDRNAVPEALAAVSSAVVAAVVLRKTDQAAARTRSKETPARVPAMES
jgi:hypothetical protein